MTPPDSSEPPPVVSSWRICHPLVDAPRNETTASVRERTISVWRSNPAVERYTGDSMTAFEAVTWPGRPDPPDRPGSSPDAPPPQADRTTDRATGPSAATVTERTFRGYLSRIRRGRTLPDSVRKSALVMWATIASKESAGDSHYFGLLRGVGAIRNDAYCPGTRSSGPL